MILEGEIVVTTARMSLTLIYCVLHVWVTIQASSVWFHPSLASLLSALALLHLHPPSHVLQTRAVLYALMLHSELYPQKQRERVLAEGLLLFPVPIEAKTVLCNLFLGSLGIRFSARYPYAPQTFPNSSLQKWRWNQDHYNFFIKARENELVTLVCHAKRGFF